MLDKTMKNIANVSRSDSKSSEKLLIESSCSFSEIPMLSGYDSLPHGHQRLIFILRSPLFQRV